MFENIIQRFKNVSKEEEWVIKILIGGILLFIPVLNAVSFGYLMDILEDVKEKREIQLPKWQNFEKLFMDGLPVAILLFAVIFVLFLLVQILGFFPCLGQILGLVISTGFSFFLPVLLVIFSYRLKEFQDWKQALNIQSILGDLQKDFKDYLPFLLALLVCGPASFLLGCCFFAGIPYFYSLVAVFPLMGEIYLKSHSDEMLLSTEENSEQK